VPSPTEIKRQSIEASKSSPKRKLPFTGKKKNTFDLQKIHRSQISSITPLVKKFSEKGIFRICLTHYAASSWTSVAQDSTEQPALMENGHRRKTQTCLQTALTAISLKTRTKCADLRPEPEAESATVFTYQELHKRVNRSRRDARDFAGLKKPAIASPFHMPMIRVADHNVACAGIGVFHSVVCGVSAAKTAACAPRFGSRVSFTPTAITQRQVGGYKASVDIAVRTATKEGQDACKVIGGSAIPENTLPKHTMIYGRVSCRRSP